MKVLEFTDGSSPVKVRVICGLGESHPPDAGWYVFCNGRLLLRADKTNTTGWGEDDGETIPQFHNQFARVRGLVFFDCDDASLLPWNTTKTGVDADSPIYAATRQQMIVLARPVFDFLNKLQSSEGPSVGDVLDGATSVGQAALTVDKPFAVPDVLRVRTVTIQYSKPVDKVEKAKRVLRVTSARQVGDRAFDYYYALECEE